MDKPEKTIEGAVYVLGDNIDTDQIIPACYLNLVPTIADEYRRLGSHALSGLPDTMPPFVPVGASVSPYTVIVAGRNFGCGSSREHAPVCLGAAGVKAVVAVSYARIFFRNAVATGELYPFETRNDLTGCLRTGDRVRIDVQSHALIKVDDAARHPLEPLGAVAPVIAAGGIFGYARETGMIGGEKP